MTHSWLVPGDRRDREEEVKGDERKKKEDKCRKRRGVTRSGGSALWKL